MEQIFTFHSYINSIRGVSSRLHIDSLTKLNITRIKVFLGLENVPTAFDEQQKIYDRACRGLNIWMQQGQLYESK